MTAPTVLPSAHPRHPLAWTWRRELKAYPPAATRRLHLGLVVLITVALYYELYVGGGVATLILGQLHMSFGMLVTVLAISNLAGAFASLLAGLCDRFGRANLVVYGLLVVGLLTLFAAPAVQTRLEWAAVTVAIGFIEGIILVATPALIRDFSPQLDRATAMGFWTIGPVLGSLMVSLATSLTLPVYQSWQSQYVFCGAVGLVVFALAFVFLRELAPALRDQLVVSDHDRRLVEARARGLDIEARLRHPWRQMLRPDIIASAFGVSVLLLIYYTLAAFGVIYFVITFGYSVAEANGLLNWSWGANALALIAAGLLSDRLRVRKPFMLFGGIGTATMIVLFLQQAGQHPSHAALVAISCALFALLGFAYTAWMASFTETLEAHNPALTATGLAIWGWLLRIVVTASFLALPHVVNTVTPLIEAPAWIAAYREMIASHVMPGPDMLAHLAVIQQAAADSAGQWRSWYWICLAGTLVFVALIPTMKGRWSPAAAKADEDAHDEAVERELARLQATGALNTVCAYRRKG
ncbi:MAG TPA: MFS transporter [Acetobacteraceae bacterium]|nr:MFS transporter [Acetobacteraceae bacterium]